MASKTSIVNLALVLLGQKRINDITEDSTTARLANEVFGQTLDEVLVMGPEKGWKFANARQSVSVSATAPDFEYDYQYQIPADPTCLLVRSVQVDDTELTDWVQEGDYILTSEEDEEVDIKYTKRVTDESKFPPHFIKVLYYSIAIHLEYPLTQSSKHSQALQIQLDSRVLPRAVAMDEKAKYVEEYNTDWVDHDGH